MSRAAVSSLAIIVAALILAQLADARPTQNLISRLKRTVSDQRLAELETLVSLGKMKGKLITVPLGFGQVNPDKLGRKRRSSTESNLLELRRILRSVLVDNVELSPRDRSRFAQFISSQWDATDQEDTPSNEDDLLMY